MLGVSRSKTERDIVQVLWCSIIFGIWKRRNMIIFYNAHMDTIALVEAIKYQAWSWKQHKPSSFNSPYVLWTRNPEACIRRND